MANPLVVATLDAADRPADGALTYKQERFCVAMAQLNNATAAYRAAYDVAHNAIPQTVTTCGYALARLPKVAARVKQLRAEFAAGAISDMRELAQWYYDIATADPNEIVAWAHSCCRHCYGVKHAYQWRNEDEYTDAYMRTADQIAELQALNNHAGRAAAAKLKLPNDLGGYGFDKRLEPALLCPECCGRGEQQMHVADTTKLTGKARLLYKGMKVTKNGIEVLLHDQDHAREQLGRMMGAFKDPDPRRMNTPIEGESAAMPENVSPEDAARAYLQLMD